MGSFQQITMGVICLVGAFWFGAYLQDRPAGQNQTAQLLPDGTIDPNQPSAGSNFLESTKGFLSSLFEPPAKKKPITVNDLRQRSQIETPNTPSLQALHQQDQSSPNMVNENLLRLTGNAQEAPAEQRFVGSFVSDSATDDQVQPLTPPTQAKVAIVPDFSSLAEEVNRGLSFNEAPATQSFKRPDVELIPVPKFSDVQTRKQQPPVADADWESVRQQVAAAQSRLDDYRQQMTEPIPDIAVSVTQRTQEFWDRQQSEARRKSTQLVRSQPLQQRQANPSNQLSSARQSRLKPETFADKQKRWDVFSPDQAVQSQTASTQTSTNTNTNTIQNATTRAYQPQQPTIRQMQPTIVEVDRGFSSADRGLASQQTPPAGNPSARVRSLNDDRNSGMDESPYVQPEQNRIASHQPMIRQSTEVQNQLRPEFDPNPGSSPEFVSPPEYGEFQAQQNPPSSTTPTTPTSEIVEAASVAYGSFSEYKTQPTDTLQNISQKFYGSPDYYFDLYLANRDLLGNPATVPAGLTIKIPKFDGR